MTWWLSKLAGAVLVLLVVWTLVRLFEWKSLYYPSRAVAATPAALGLEFEDIDFMAEDGVRLHGWWVPSEAARGTLLFCHGNAGNIGDRVEIVADLHRLGLNIFIFDYRGYGRSKGLPTEKGTYRDARAAYEVIRATYRDAEAPPVVVYGRSLGGAVAVQLAADKPVRGLILESAFSSTMDMGRHLYPGLPVALVCRYKYDSLSKVPGLLMPKLLAHSREDEIVPYALGRKLFDAAAEPRQFVDLSGGHNDPGWYSTPAYWAQIEGFITQVLGPDSQD